MFNCQAYVLGHLLFYGADWYGRRHSEPDYLQHIQVFGDAVVPNGGLIT